MHSRLPRLDQINAKRIAIERSTRPVDELAAEIDGQLSARNWDEAAGISGSGVAFLPIGDAIVPLPALRDLRHRVSESCGRFGYPGKVFSARTVASEIDLSCGQVLWTWWLEQGVPEFEACHAEVWSFLNVVCFADIILWRFAVSADPARPVASDYEQGISEMKEQEEQVSRLDRLLNWGKKRAWMTNLWWMMWLCADSEGHVDGRLLTIAKVPQYRMDLLERSGRGYDRETIQQFLLMLAMRVAKPSRKEFRRMCMDLIRLRAVNEPAILDSSGRKNWVAARWLRIATTEVYEESPAEVAESVSIRWKSTLPRLPSADHVRVPLVAGDGEVPRHSGLNWGQREGRDHDQAYLQLPPAIYHGCFFPERPSTFVVETDDGELLDIVRAQKGDGGQALQTSKSNALLGRYFRKRLGLNPGALITRSDLERYGRTHVDFYKRDDGSYLMDFSVDQD